MTEHNFEQMRRAMVASQLRTTGVNDPRVVAAMGEVPRERFIPQELCAAAYADLLLPLGHGRELNSPMALGRMLSEAGLRGNERALVIGAATGYSAAVLARLAAEVVAVEDEPELAAFAREALSGTGAELIEAPLADGYAPGGPYDFVLFDGAIEQVPQTIIDQVADGGQISLALMEAGISRLCLGRVVAGAFGTTAYADVAAAVIPGFEKSGSFRF